MNVLIIKTTSLGDVLHSTISLNLIKKTYPDTKITFMVDKSAYPILKHNKLISKFIIFDYAFIRNNWLKHPIKTIKYIKKIVREIKSKHFDLAFDLQGLLRSVFFLYLARADRKYVKGRWIFLNKYKNKKIHAINEIKNVLALANINTNNNHKIEIYTSEIEKKTISKLIQNINPNNKKLIVISPFSRWQSKDWGLKNYSKLIRLMYEDEFCIVFTGVSSTKAHITELLSGYQKDNAHNLTGKLELLELVELIRRADLLLSSDGFPVHIASAFDTPVIALFGATDENRVGPLSGKSIVIRKQIHCAKCYKKKCKNKICMDRITAEEVLYNINTLFSTLSGREDPLNPPHRGT